MTGDALTPGRGQIGGREDGGALQTLDRLAPADLASIGSRSVPDPRPDRPQIPHRSAGQTPGESKAAICQASAVMACTALTPPAVCLPHQRRSGGSRWESYISAPQSSFGCRCSCTSSHPSSLGRGRGGASWEPAAAERRVPDRSQNQSWSSARGRATPVSWGLSAAESAAGGAGGGGASFVHQLEGFHR